MSILFNSKAQEYAWLSNFFVSPITLDEKEYPTVEHWFQSQKFTDRHLQEKIRLCDTPAVAKRLGRTRDTSFLSNWDEIKEDIMLKGLRAKFMQNETLKNQLLQTGSALLEEEASWDSYWGLGRSGKGKNRMGFLLMKVRDELSSCAFFPVSN